MGKPCFTIFGGTGDLTFRKLLPALYNLSAAGTLPAGHTILIVGRRDYDSAQYRALARTWVREFSRLPYTDAAFDRFAGQIAYYRMDFTNLGEYPALDRWYREQGISRCIFYFAVAPRFFTTLTQGLELVRGAHEGKVILEKPFGEGLEGAGALNRRLEAFFTPERIYRIDHYLGKEMVRGIQTLRFANPILADAWDARHVECVQISALEEVGVETRGGYYDGSGALRDMVQNHLFQILSILAMEAPADFTPQAMHSRQIEVLRALRLPEAGQAHDALVLGQYDGYRAEPKVSPESRTETYAALRLFLNTARWQGVPFYIRTGKRLSRREMAVKIVFRAPSPGVEPGLLTVRIQPSEGVSLRFNIKTPGEGGGVTPVEMDFCQSCVLENRLNTPEAYERLLVACMKGERSWFSQWDQIEAGWRFVDELRALHAVSGAAPFHYAPGSDGPAQADALLARHGHRWM